MIKKIAVVLTLCLLTVWQLSASSQFSDSVFHMKQNIVDFSDTGIAENVRGGDFVNPSLDELVVGSIFQDVDGDFKKVVKITEGRDGTVFIDTIQPELREVLEFMYIPTQELTIEIDDLAEALEEGSQDYADGTSSRLSGSFNWNGKSWTLKKGNKATVKLNLKNVHGDINVKMNFGAGLPYEKVSWKKKWFIWYPVFSHVKGYVNARYDHNLGLGLTVGVSVETNDGAFSTDDLPIYELGGGGLGVGLYNVDSLEGRLSIDDTIDFRNRVWAEAGCSLDGLGIICWPTGCWGKGGSQVYFSNSLDVTAEAKLKVGFYLKGKVTWSSFKLVECSVGGGPFLGLEGSFHYGLSYNALGGNDSMGRTIINNGWHIDPKPTVKASLSAGLYADGEVTVLNDKWKKQFLDEEWSKPIFKVSN